MANVVTGEVRRIAHHRSRSPQANYYYTPRVSASWDGSVVTWASNMGYSGTGYADIYATRIADASSGGGTTPSPLSTSFNNPASGAIVVGTVTVSFSAAGGSGGYAYTVKVGTSTIYSGTNTSFSWNTATATNGSVTLSVTATDSAGATASASRTVTVSNTTTTPAPGLTVSFVSPLADSTVSKSITVAYAAGGGSTSGYTYTVTAGGATIFSGSATSFRWNTKTVADGPLTLTVTVRDSAGAMASAARSVTVRNTTGPRAP